MAPRHHKLRIKSRRRPRAAPSRRRRGRTTAPLSHRTAHLRRVARRPGHPPARRGLPPRPRAGGRARVRRRRISPTSVAPRHSNNSRYVTALRLIYKLVAPPHVGRPPAAPPPGRGEGRRSRGRTRRRRRRGNDATSTSPKNCDGRARAGAASAQASAARARSTIVLSSWTSRAASSKKKSLARAQTCRRCPSKRAGFLEFDCGWSLRDDFDEEARARCRDLSARGDDATARVVFFESVENLSIDLVAYSLSEDVVIDLCHWNPDSRVDEIHTIGKSLVIVAESDGLSRDPVNAWDLWIFARDVARTLTNRAQVYHGCADPGVTSALARASCRSRSTSATARAGTAAACTKSTGPVGHGLRFGRRSTPSKLNGGSRGVSRCT